MADPTPPDELARVVRAELVPLHNELAALKTAIDGNDGLRERIVRMEERVDHLRQAVGAPAPNLPPPRSVRSDDSDQGDFTLKLSGGGWLRLGKRLLGMLVPTSIGAGGTYLATHAEATPPPTEAPRAVTAPVPPGSIEDPQETP